MAALYVLVSSLFYQDFPWEKMLRSLLQSMTLPAGILFIVANARVFTWLFICEAVPAYFVTVLQPLADKPVLLIDYSIVVLFTYCHREHRVQETTNR